MLQPATPTIREPVGRPRTHATADEIDFALNDAANYLRAGGPWTATLRWYVNRWLDRAIELRR